VRKVNVLEFVSLDGVIQAPGGPKEDTSGGFEYGGWTVPQGDAAEGAAMMKQMKAPTDVLLGRKTFEMFAAFWPQHADNWPEVQTATKYVASNSITSSEWKPFVFLSGDTAKKSLKSRSRTGQTCTCGEVGIWFRHC
jgi:dihydrofolate reductase